MHIFSLLVSGFAAITIIVLELNAPSTVLARSSVALIATAISPALALPFQVAIEARYRE